MKRFLVIPIVVLILCSGCSKQNTILPTLSNISFTAQINYGEQEFVCDITIDNQNLNLVVLEPWVIKGFAVNINEVSTNAEFKGVSYTQDFNSSSQGAITNIILNVIKDASVQDMTCDDENCVITGKVDDYVYKFTFAPSGLPIYLTIDDIDLKINFKNITVN
ncbi:MAG: hypothetical protein IKU82_01605 [Clostridia bacterium]|nr:hypothetical protein [Clostridia bacterium]